MSNLIEKKKGEYVTQKEVNPGKFHFQERNVKTIKLRKQIDFDAVADFDLDRVLSKGEAWSLSQILDTVTFGDLPVYHFPDKKALEYSEVKLLFKTIRISQTIIEYLLHTQEILVQERGKAAHDASKAYALLKKEKLRSKSLQKKLYSVSDSQSTINNADSATIVDENNISLSVDSREEGREQLNGNQKSVYKCQFCDKNFINSTYLHNHIQRRHSEELSENVECEFRENVNDKKFIERSGNGDELEIQNQRNEMYETEMRKLKEVVIVERSEKENLKSATKQLKTELDTLQNHYDNIHFQIEEKERLMNEKEVENSRYKLESFNLRKQLDSKGEEMQKAESEITNTAKAMEFLLQSYKSATKLQESFLEKVALLQNKEISKLNKKENPIETSVKADSVDSRRDVASGGNQDVQELLPFLKSQISHSENNVKTCIRNEEDVSEKESGNVNSICSCHDSCHDSETQNSVQDCSLEKNDSDNESKSVLEDYDEDLQEDLEAYILSESNEDHKREQDVSKYQPRNSNRGWTETERDYIENVYSISDEYDSINEGEPTHVDDFFDDEGVSAIIKDDELSEYQIYDNTVTTVHHHHSMEDEAIDQNGLSKSPEDKHLYLNAQSRRTTSTFSTDLSDFIM